MFRDFDLRFSEHFLEMANAERRLRQQMQNAQARSVAKALVNLDEIHASSATPGRRALLALRWRASLAVDSAFFLCETSGVLLSELKLDVFSGKFRDREGILCGHAAVIFHYHVKIVVRQHLLAELKIFAKVPAFSRWSTSLAT